MTRPFSQRLQHVWLTRGVVAWSLRPLAWLFGLLASARRALYRRGVFKTWRATVPVVVVGNLAVGGVGKTPVVMAVVDALRRSGHTPGIVSRGHGGPATGLHNVTRASSAPECGDEPLLLHLRTGAAVVIGRDRAAAVQRLLSAHRQVDIVVSDDGLQHLGLGRDVQVLVFDERGAGNGWLLPAGLLREAIPARLPAASLVVYNAPAASTWLPGFLSRRRLLGAVSLADWWRGVPASMAVLDSLRGRPLCVAAGLGHPERFFTMLRTAGLQIHPLALPDHHDYATLPWPAETPDVIVTEKDAVKLAPDRIGPARVWVAPLDLQLDAGFEAALTDLLPPPTSPAHGNTTA